MGLSTSQKVRVGVGVGVGFAVGILVVVIGCAYLLRLRKSRTAGPFERKSMRTCMNCPMQKCYSYRDAAAYEERERYRLQSELMRQHAVECQRDTLSACTSQAVFD